MESGMNPPSQMNFEGNIAQNWLKYKQRFLLYLEASEKTKKPGKLKVALLLNQMGDQAIDIYNTFTFDTEADKHNFEKVINKFDEYCQPRKNIVFDRFRFFSRSQEVGESVDKYVTDLKKMANPCEFGDELSNLIRDRLVLGLLDKTTQERLLREPDLKLEKALDICRANEISKQQVEQISSASNSNVEAVWKFKTANMKKQWHKREESEDMKKKTPCSRCGINHQMRKCPAHGKQCVKCRKMNHFASQCKFEKNIHGVLEESDENVSESDEDYSDEMANMVILSIKQNVKMVNSVVWRENLLLENKIISCKIDTGSEVNLISMKIYKSLNSKPKLAETNIKLSSYSGHIIETLGVCFLNCKFNDKLHVLKFFITKENAEPVLGLEASYELGLIKNNHSITHNSAHKIIDDYADVFGNAGVIHYKPYHITLRKDAKPSIASARIVPLSLKKKLKLEIDKLVENKVLEPVDEPTDWVHPIVVVPKPNGSLRVCMDPRSLNKYIKREHYSLPTVENALAEVHGAEVFTVLDASTAFLQVPLDKHSSSLCTIATPFGRYRYKTMPYGINSASEIYQKIINHILGGLEGVIPYIDDVLIFGKNIEEHNQRLKNVLDRARKYNLHFSKSKLQLALPQIKFLGHLVTKNGIKIDSSKVKAIENMLIPKNKQELQRFLGMINYLGKFIRNLSQLTSPLRKLLSKTEEYIWTDAQEQSYQELKSIISKAPVLKFYNPNQPLCISVDASSHGLGAVAMQEGKPLAYCSTSLNSTQRNYAQIEKEMLAVLHGLERFSLYTHGREVLVQTDHKPLLSIVKKPMHMISPRLQRMLLKLMRFSFQLEYVPGKNLYIPDTLSRQPMKDEEMKTPYLEGQSVAIHTIISANEERTAVLKKAVENDPVLTEIISYVKQGWPRYKNNIKSEAKNYWNVKEEIHSADGLLFRGNRLVIPASERRRIIENLHSAHQGVTSCQNKAHNSLYWPSMLKDIENYILNCQICQRYSKSNIKQPLTSHEIPEYPWSKIGMDFMKLRNQEYLVMTDYFSKFVIVKIVQLKTSKAICRILEETFPIFGIPMEIMSDNGPPFSSMDWKIFMNFYDIKHITSSPTYSRSNGMIERQIQTVKALLNKSSEKSIPAIILEYNTTPKHGLPSPAEMLMGRRLRTNLPTAKQLLIPNFEISQMREIQKKNQDRQKQYYNRISKPLSQLGAQSKILIQEHTRKWTPGIVIGATDHPDSYLVQTEEGTNLRRNRLHLRPLREENNELTMTPVTSGSTKKTDNASPRLDVTATPPRQCTPSAPSPTTTNADSECSTHMGNDFQRPKRSYKKPAHFKDFELF